ncbi:carbohydrate ABC transporter permease [Paenibacillus sp. DMB20]|uniref:carbohydrate ABC transporter permease n=1 Tax=Paenibacillus sp. DMB20 TaxID=1642570 RepID=UPI000A7631C0
MRRFQFTLSRKKALMGILFTLPWLIGFIFLFAVPLLQSLQYSFHSLKLGEGGLELDFVGAGNFKHAFYVHASFNRVLTESVVGMIVNVPLIIFFSLFVATILNQKFRGRALARMIFFPAGHRLHRGHLQSGLGGHDVSGDRRDAFGRRRKLRYAEQLPVEVFSI